MANKKYDRKAPEQKQKELEEISAEALSHIEKYSRSPKDLLEYAKFMSKFHNYSTNNTALIQRQFNGAEAVASFKDWKENGYFVNKGEKGIKILSYTPITFFKDKNGQQKTLYSASKEEKQLIKDNVLKSWKVPHFKLGHVFDVSQTNCPPEDLPKVFPNRQFNFTIEEGNNGKYLQKGIEAVAKELNISVRDMKDSELGLHELGSAKGAFVQAVDGKKEILLNSRNTDTQSLSTAIHELAHARLHDKSQEESKFDSSTKEFQAELTSYVVCQHYGMDTSEKAIPYIAGWTQNGAKIEDKQKALEGVHRTSREFIEIMDQVIAQEKEKDLQKDVTIDPQMPTVNFEWSESSQVPEGKAMSLLEADQLLMTLNQSRHGEGYDKTKFNIHYALDGENHTYQGRYDIGDEKGGLVDHIEKVTNHALEYGEYYNEEGKKSLEFVQDKVLPMFRDIVGEPEIEGTGYYPKDPEEVRYCELTGEPFANLDPYYYVDGGTVLSEKAHSVLYTDKEWEEIYEDDSDDNYWTEEMYDLPESELTDVKPKPIYNDIYYKYNPNDQTKPEKLGTISDIVSKASKQAEGDRFSVNREFITDLSLNRGKDKDEFNGIMEKYSVLKNPTLSDFQRVNEKEGVDKNANLEEMVQEQLELRRQVARQRAYQR